MRFVLLALPLLATACSGGEEATALAQAKGRVMTIVAECEITGGPPAKTAPRGKCNDILPKARAQEFRGTEVRRKLKVKYAYTAPGDGQLFEGAGELDQILSSPIPRAGDQIDVWVNPANPAQSRLTR